VEITTATVDRLLHHVHIVVTGGGSYRLAQATAACEYDYFGTVK
jgi:DNA replication protein DnaC